MAHATCWMVVQHHAICQTNATFHATFYATMLHEMLHSFGQRLSNKVSYINLNGISVAMMTCEGIVRSFAMFINSKCRLKKSNLNPTRKHVRYTH